MKKKLIALSIASAVAGVGQVQALDLTGTAATAAASTLFYASELSNPGSIIITHGDGTTGSALNVKAPFGFSIAAGTSKYIRADFTALDFKDPLTAAGNVAVTSAATTTTTLSTGGALNTDSVIFEIAAITGNIGPTDTVTIGLGDVFITGASTATFRLFETAADATNETSALSTASGTLLGLEASLGFTPTTVVADKIDVTQGTTFFNGGTKDVTTTIGKYTLSDKSAVATATVNQVLIASGATATYGTIVGATSTVAYAADFTALQDLTGGAPDGTYTVTKAFLDVTSAACAAAAQSSTAITDTSATFAAAATIAAWGCVTVNGVSVIPAQTFTATWTPVATSTAYTVAASTITQATHLKNGSTIVLNIALTPTNITPPGTYSNFIRIVNTSVVAGDVTLTLWNDSGDVTSFSLASIPAVGVASLGAQSSTALINVNDIFQVAQFLDPTFALTGDSRKLRIMIEGEFSSIAAQNFSVSTDATVFATF